MTLEKLTSSIYNNVMSGLRGLNISAPLTLEQIEDGIINERMIIIKEYAAKNLIPAKDLTYSIRCVDVDCESLERCSCTIEEANTLKHIEIPQTLNDFGDASIDFIGSADGEVEYTVYTTRAHKAHKYRRRGANKPYVWIDTTPNKNNMYDAFIFNASPLVKTLLVRLIPKDPRQLSQYSCCSDDEIYNITFIDAEIEKRLSEKYLRYYRQGAMPVTQNDLTVKA